MRLSETRDLFAERLEFPSDRDTVVAAVGSIELEAPTGDSESIAEVVRRSGIEEFDSADDLYDAVIGTVGDQYIGRKFYDDRGSQAGIDTEEESF